MKPAEFDPHLFHLFLEYFLFKPESVMAGKQLYQSRAPSTWKIYLRSARRVWAQSRVIEVQLFPLSGEKLLEVLGSVKRGKWTARQWVQAQQYLKIVCDLNATTLDPRVLLMIRGQAKQNIVPLARRRQRPVLDPERMRVMLFKMKSMKKTHAQQRAILAVYLAYYAVGRSFDISYLKGENLEFGPDFIKIHFHVRKNNKLALRRHIATVYSSYNFMCPVLNILKAVAFMNIGPSQYLFHKEGEKDERMDPSAIIQGVKQIQKKAGCDPVLTLTDIRASATTSLAEGGVSNFHIMLWGNWESDMIKSYARSNDRLKKSLQSFLQPKDN